MAEINGMNLIEIPIGLSAQDWARLFNYNLSIVDYHNHTLNNGVKIPSVDLGSGDLLLNSQNMNNVNFLNFAPTSTGSTQPYCLFVSPGGDLIYENTVFSLPITSGGGLNITSLPEGFTVVGSPPIAIFDTTNSVFSIKFESSVGANTSTINVDTVNCVNFTVENIATVSVTDLPLDPHIIKTGTNHIFLGVNLSPGPTYTTFESSYVADVTLGPTGIYKLSENGVFYYTTSSAGSQDLSYFLGSKNWVSSNNNTDIVKTGTRYYMKTVSFSIVGLKVDQTFLLDDNLNNSNLVSFIPKVSTTSTNEIGSTNTILSNIQLPTFKV